MKKIVTPVINSINGHFLVIFGHGQLHPVELCNSNFFKSTLSAKDSQFSKENFEKYVCTLMDKIHFICCLFSDQVSFLSSPQVSFIQSKNTLGHY